MRDSARNTTAANALRDLSLGSAVEEGHDAVDSHGAVEDGHDAVDSNGAVEDHNVADDRR